MTSSMPTSRKRRAVLLSLAKGGIIGAAGVTFALAVLVQASNNNDLEWHDYLLVEDSLAVNEDGHNDDDHRKQSGGGGGGSSSSHNSRMISKSKLQEINSLSRQIHMVHSSNTWSEDSLDTMHSLENVINGVRGDSFREWMEERGRDVEQKIEEGYYNEERNRRLTEIDTEPGRRQLSVDVDTRMNYDQVDVSQRTNNLRSHNGNRSRRGLSPKHHHTTAKTRHLGRGVGMRRSSNGKSGKSTSRMHYVMVRASAPSPSITRVEPGNGRNETVHNDNDDGSRHEDNWMEESHRHDDDEYYFYEECYDSEDLEHIKWASPSGHRELELEELGNGAHRRRLGRTYYYMDRWNANSKSGKDDSKSGKDSKSHSSEWWSAPWWSASAAWSGSSHDSSHHHHGNGTDDDVATHSPNDDDTSVIMMVPNHSHSKSGKSDHSKSGKSKSGNACYFLRMDGQVGDKYCGVDFEHASMQCSIMCESHEDCSRSEYCFGGVTTCMEGDKYCGSDLDDASSQCAVKCESDSDCTGGESCFGGITSCADDKYCGADLEDAGLQCAIKCDSDGDCPGGESCFDGVTSCSGEKYCGADLEDAGSQCAVKCDSDGDCPSGESCFDGVTSCLGDKYCGADSEDAGSQCAIQCDSDTDCPGGESCFGGVTSCSDQIRPSTPAPKTPRPTPKPTSRPTRKPTTPRPTKEGTTSFPTLSPTDFEPEPTAPPCPQGCPDCDPNSPLPCPPRSMKAVCDKNNDELYPPGTPKAGTRVANFIDCYDMCKPSFCCIHDSTSKVLSPSCSAEYKNCPLYYPCYIIWWKLHDTIGPATYMRVEQDEPFFGGLTFEQLETDFAQDEEFFGQLFNHHFDGDGPLTDDTFEEPDNW